MKNLTYILLFALAIAISACKTNRDVVKPLNIASILQPGMSKKEVSRALNMKASTNSSFSEINGKNVSVDVVTYEDKAAKPPKSYLLYFRNDSLVNWHDSAVKSDNVIEFVDPKNVKEISPNGH